MSKDGKNNTHIIETVDKVIHMYPELKKDRANIITNVIGVTPKETTKELEVIKCIVNDKTYYRDKNGSLWNEEAKMVGVYKWDDNEYKYYFLNDDSKKNIKKSCDKMDNIKKQFDKT